MFVLGGFQFQATKTLHKYNKSTFLIEMKRNLTFRRFCIEHGDIPVSLFSTVLTGLATVIGKMSSKSRAITWLPVTSPCTETIWLPPATAYIDNTKQNNARDRRKRYLIIYI